MARKNLPRNLSEDKHLKRGEFDWAVSQDNIVCLKWRDRGTTKKCVHILSSIDNPVDVTSVDRKDKDGTVLKISCPQSVVDYNKNMGFVDHFDHLKSLYEVDRKSKKWWHRIFFHFLDVSIVNAFIIYKEATDTTAEFRNVKDFRLQIIRHLTIMGKESAPSVSRKRPSTQPLTIKSSKPHVEKDLRVSKLPHLPVRCTSRRCAYCSTKSKPHRSNTMCGTCKVPLCTQQKGVTCFQKFHAI